MNSVWTIPRNSAEDLRFQDHQELSPDHPERSQRLPIEDHPDKTESKVRLSKEEVEILEKVFQEHPKPSNSVKAQLADRFGLERPRVNNWFQNRRAKAKQERKQEGHEAGRAAETAVSKSSSPNEATPETSESLDKNALQSRKPLSAPFSSVTELQESASPYLIMQEDDSERDHPQNQSNENSDVQEWAKKQEKPLSRSSTNKYTAPSTGHEGGGEISPRRFSWIEGVVWKLNHFRNMLSDRMQPRIASGHVRVSWTCRCGKRLCIEVPKTRQAAGIAFAQQASGPSNVDSVSYRSSDVDESSSTSSSTQAFASRSLSQSSGFSLDSPSTAPSIDSDAGPFIPAGTKKYLLLCVNTGIRRISLTNVDVTNVVDDEEIFKKLQAEYHNLRGQRIRNPLIKPKMMHYIKFQLLYLQKSKECVGNYEFNSIPSRTEIYRQEYAFSPCPPALGDLPIPPALFMHAFLDPGDHMGSMAVEMLPKKLRRDLSWDDSINNSLNVPVGWGFYIIEGLDWLGVTWCIVITTLAVTLLTILWSALMQDVQGGTGIGQYCIAVLAVMVSAVLLTTEGLHGPA
ncbi:hypothetical protein F4782DRAFT_512657 [Xylaria castorea]|nr:hypothetical protein F4782DRAFT_512657 [Xylaria castorea]